MLTGNLTDHVAGEQHVDYMMVFGSERHPNVPAHSHTFAAFLRLIPGAGPGPGEGEPLTISWLPRTRIIVPLQLRPEPGWNFELIETLNWIFEADPSDPGVTTYVYAWGPFRINPILRDHAAARIAELGSGGIEYVVEDLLFRPHIATNCIHALSDLGLTNLLLHTLGSHGREASWKVVHYLGPWIMNPSQTYEGFRNLFGIAPYENRIHFEDYRADASLEFAEPHEGPLPTPTSQGPA